MLPRNGSRWPNKGAISTVWGGKSLPTLFYWVTFTPDFYIVANAPVKFVFSKVTALITWVHSDATLP